MDSGPGLTTVGCGRSASLLGNVTGSLALGLTSPKRMLATASEPALPANQASRIALTWPTQGMVTGPPDSTTTTVCGLAAATLAMRLSWWSGRARLSRSMPSLSHWCTKTMATSDDFARAAAAAGSEPELNSTLAPGALARIDFSGDVGNQMCSCQ